MKKLISALLILTMMLSLCACSFDIGSLGVGGPSALSSLFGGDLHVYDTGIRARVDKDNTCYYYTHDGGVLTVQGDGKAGILSPDGTKLTYLDNNGRLSWYNSDLQEQFIIAENVDSIRSMDNNAVLYSSGKDYYRYSFKDESKLSLGSTTSWALSPENLNILYVKDDSIYLLRYDSDEPEKLSSAEGGASPIYISSDGTIAFWYTSDSSNSSEKNVYCFENGEKTKLGTITLSGYNYVYITVSNDQQNFIISNFLGGANSFIFKQRGKDAVRVNIGDGVFGTRIYTADNSFYNCTEKNLNGFYGVISNNDGSSIYWIDSTGEKEKLISDIRSSYDFAVINGYIYYIDSDYNLMAVDVKGAKLGKTTRIASDVYSIEHGSSGKNIYYLKNVEGTEGTLYYLSSGSDKSEKISGSVNTDITVSADSKTVFFYKNVEEVSAASLSTAALYRYDIGDKEAEKICSDVLLGNLIFTSSTPLYGNLNMFILKYNSCSDGIKYLDTVYYNGKECVTVTKDIAI